MNRDEQRRAFAAKNARRRAEKLSLGNRYAQVRAARRARTPAGAFGRATADALRSLQ